MGLLHSLLPLLFQTCPIMFPFPNLVYYLGLVYIYSKIFYYNNFSCMYWQGVQFLGFEPRLQG